MSFSSNLFLREDGLVATIDYTRRSQNEHDTPLVEDVQAVAPVRYITHETVSGSGALHAVTDGGRWFERTGGTFQERKVVNTNGDPERIIMVVAAVFTGAALTESGSVYVYSFNGDGGSAVPAQRRPYERMASESFDHARIVFIANHTGGSYLAVSDAGGVYMWGPYDTDKFPYIDPDPDFFTVRKVDPAMFDDERVEFVAANGNESCAVTESGHCIFWHGEYMGNSWPVHGRESIFWRLGPDDFEGEKPVMVSMATNKRLVVTDQGSLWMQGTCDKADGEGPQFVLLHSESFVRVPRDMLGGTDVTVAHAAEKKTIVATADGSVWRLVARSTRQIYPPTACDAFRVYNPGSAGVRAGRFVRDAERELAVCMSANERLGAASGLQALSGEPELLRLIVQAGRPLDLRQKSTWALARLLGGWRLLPGGDADRQRDIESTPVETRA